MIGKVLQFLSAERLAVGLVVFVGAIVGAYAGQPSGLEPLQWGGAAMAMIGSVLVAVVIHTWPEKEKAKAKA